MDIVERLNDDAQCFCSIRKEAAAEIERLREALKFYADRNHKSDDGDCIESGQIARSALHQKESE